MSAAEWPVVAVPGAGWSDPVAAVSPAGREDADEPIRGQLRFAERLVRRDRDALRYVHGIGWHIWDGARWAPDLDGASVRLAVDTVKAAYDDLHRLGRDDQKELIADIHKCESAAGLDGMLRLAGSMLPFAVSVGQLDADPYLLNCQDGTLDLHTGVLRPHDPADLLTKVAGCGYDPDASSPLFERFLRDVLPDDAMRAYIGRIFGHALVGKVIEHTLPILTGSGCNGKSTLYSVVMAAFGDYAIAAEPDLLVDKGAAHPTGQADLLGVRLAVCSETDNGRRLASATVKRLTGGDKIRARRMRQDFIEFKPSHSVVLVTNHKPQVAGDDPALWRRLRVIPFDVVVEAPDTSLPELLLLELPAVLRWLVAGHDQWAATGMAEPEQVLAATEAYRASSDSLGRFLDECCLELAAATVKARELFGAWCAWCHRGGEEPGTEKAFAESMGARGVDKIKSYGVMTYRGLGLASADEERRP